ncbi:MAG: lipopolysaccharide biosynthesis protein [Myxococcales bacterium]
MGLGVATGVFARAQALATKLFGRSGSLVLSRILSAIITFGLPLALVRIVDPTGYGTYKQFFLIANTALLIGPMGMTQSLFYFLPREKSGAGSYAAQSFVALFAIGLCGGAALFFGAPLLAHFLESPGLLEARGSLALYAGAMLAATPLEPTLTSSDRPARAAVAYTVTDALRAGGMVAGAVFLGGPWIFRAAAAVALLRVVALWTLAVRGSVPFGRPSRTMLRAQLAFALPFAGSSVLWVAQRQFSQYAVSASFDPATFALFAVGCFHLQVVDIIYTPMSEVLMVDLAHLAHAGNRSVASEAFREAVARLATILFPAAAGAWLLGSTVVPLLFTVTYAAAVPLFLLATVEIPIWILPCDALLRAEGETRFLLWFSAVRIAVAALLVLGGIHFFGLAGAIVGSLVTEGLSRVCMLARGCRRLGVGMRSMVDWAVLVRIAVSAAIAAGAAWPLRFFLHRAPLVLASIVVYGAAYFVCRYLFERRRPASGERELPSGRVASAAAA